jgi:hypothetical protein
MNEASEKEKRLVLMLSNCEKLLDTNTEMPNERRAQGYVCLAHDWYRLRMAEEGWQALKKAEATFPGYFRRLMVQHTIENKDFDELVKNLAIDIIDMELKS